MKRLILTLLVVTLPLLAQPVAPPAPGAPREAKLPQPVEKKLANGLRVVVVEKHNIPLVAAELLFRDGAASDPRGRDGVAQLTASLVTKGTKARGAQEIAHAVEALGATLESGAGWDSSVIDLSVMANNFDKAMGYLAESARDAAFAEEEIELERAQMSDSLQVVLGQPRSVASIVASRVVFGDAPYGHNPGGSPKSLECLTREDVVAFHKAHYRPDNAVLVVAGDVNAEAVFALARKLFGSWKAGGVRRVEPPSSPVAAKPAAGRVVVVDMPDAGQAAVLIARRGIRRTDPAYYTAIVANSVLGGGYSARLNQEIRIKRGLSYGAGSSFQPRAEAGPFTARTDTKNETATEAADLIVSLMNGLSASDVADAELTPRKASLIGEFAQSLETTGGIVGAVGELALYGLPLSDINRYIGGVQAISAQDVRKFAAGAMSGSDANVVIVGDASRFSETLGKEFGDIEIIPIAELDLDSAGLRVKREK